MSVLPSIAIVEGAEGVERQSVERQSDARARETSWRRAGRGDRARGDGCRCCAADASARATAKGWWLEGRANADEEAQLCCERVSPCCARIICRRRLRSRSVRLIFVHHFASGTAFFFLREVDGDKDEVDEEEGEDEGLGDGSASRIALSDRDRFM